MRRNSALMSLYVIALGLAFCAPALAEPPARGAADADLSAQAMDLYNEGLKAVKLGQWDKARSFYLGAWRVQHHVQIAANLGRAELKAGKHRDAAEHLTYFLREAPSIEPEDRKRTQQLLDQARAKVGALTIAVKQDGAEIRIDGALVGTSPLKTEVFVEPGRHLIEAQLKGYGPARATQELKAGDEARVDLQLAKAEPMKPGAGPALSPPAPEEEPRGVPKKTIVLVGAVAGAVAAGVGIGSTVAAQIKLNEREDARQTCQGTPTCAAFVAAERARLRFAMAAVTSYIVAGVLGAGTLTYALVKPSAKPRSAARADLLVGPGTAGAMVTVPW